MAANLTDVSESLSPACAGVNPVSAKLSRGGKAAGVVVGDDGKPGLVFDKERFSLSEALTYFEFTLEQVANHP